MRLAILTVSDAGSRGERQDTSGDAIAAWAEGRGYSLAARELVARAVAHGRQVSGAGTTSVMRTFEQIEKRDASELVPASLPKPVKFESQRDYVREVGARSGLTVHLTLDVAPTRLRSEVEGELLRVTQEAVTNESARSRLPRG